ncbi:hypothetical protein P9C27_21050 [Bacillus vallismortis]|uniref:hypothetical protein n=1 Tax=Bacillus vallismortis TaxID=72361 RepID=UPI002DBA00AC|nr:hypothetical protein [Bacillus vallismortis]MEC1270921.1 hypothetical protein [Bacillus vallismortis]
MKKLYKYDENLLWLPGEEIEIEDNAEIPAGYTDIQPESGLFKAKLNEETGKWYESASQEYIDTLCNNNTSVSTELELNNLVVDIGKQLTKTKLELLQLKGTSSS